MLSISIRHESGASRKATELVSTTNSQRSILDLLVHARQMPPPPYLLPTLAEAALSHVSLECQVLP